MTVAELNIPAGVVCNIGVMGDEDYRPALGVEFLKEYENLERRARVEVPRGLGAAMGMSRVQLYRMVKALTGLSPVELLREVRLQRAHKLLQTTDLTVAQVAYEVGFATPGYFSSCFKKQFGKYPTDVKATDKE